MKRNSSNRFSLQYAIESLTRCVSRFPVTVGYLSALSLWLVILVWSPTDLRDSRISNIILFFLSAGTLLTLVIHLWTESERTKQVKTMWMFVANALLAADCIWLYCSYDNIGTAIKLGHGAAITALAAGIFFAPLPYNRNGIVSWNFSYRVILSYLISCAISIAMGIAVITINMTLASLFGEYDEKTPMTMAIVLCILIPAMIFLGRIPDIEEKYTVTANPSKFLTATTKYLFLPVSGIYYLILLAYAVKILYRWTLPDGGICWFVTCAVVACLAIEYLLYPSRHITRSKTEDTLARWMPIILLPLLVLMTIALIRRISDYGVTISRIYMLTFNAWCYAVCIALFITRVRRLNMIPISFAIVFLLTSIIPYANYATLTRNIVRNNLKTELYACDITRLPIELETYNNLTDTLPKSRCNQIQGKTHYLLDDFGEDALDDIISGDISDLSYWYYLSAAYAYADSVEIVEMIPEDLEYSGDIPIPTGFQTVSPYRYRFYYSNEIIYEKPYALIENRKYRINIDSILSLDRLDAPVPIPCADNYSLMMISDIRSVCTADSIEYIKVGYYTFHK